jgi:hypothetical protein
VLLEDERGISEYLGTIVIVLKEASRSILCWMIYRFTDRISIEKTKKQYHHLSNKR